MPVKINFGKAGWRTDFDAIPSLPQDEHGLRPIVLVIRIGHTQKGKRPWLDAYRWEPKTTVLRNVNGSGGVSLTNTSLIAWKETGFNAPDWQENVDHLVKKYGLI